MLYTKIKHLFFFILSTLCFTSMHIHAQKIWENLPNSVYQLKQKEVLTNNITKDNYRLVRLDAATLKNKSTQKSKQSIIALPNLKEGFSNYVLQENSNLNVALAIKYPMIKSFTATSLSNKGVYAKISMGLDGFHAVVYSKGGTTYYIDPYSKDKKDYIIYDRTASDKKDFTCSVDGIDEHEILHQKEFKKITNDGLFRTYRLALTCTGEYSDFHLNRQGVSSSATEEVKKAAVLSAMNTSVTRMNGVLEKELSVKLQLVENNDNLIFLDSNTDGFNNNDDQNLIDGSQRVIDAEIGNESYDIGHIVTAGRDSGGASFQSVCRSGFKARAVTGRSTPIADFFDIDFFIHEIGHQFGATHTYNNSCGGQRFDTTAIEPGSGSTIMGYAGICAPNVQNSSDDYFHSVSIDQINNFISISGGCATIEDTGNIAPVANAGINYTIPKSTPFVLRGAATDTEDQGRLTYNWEQIDREIAVMSPVPTSIVGPLFRSLPSKTSPNRFFPDLATVVAGNTASTWEVLPSVARNMSFSLLVRDNNPLGGATGRDGMAVSVIDAVPFTVTAPNSSVVWDVGSSQTITWNKGSTDVAPINCNNVTIRLSVDGGVTFPIVVKENTPNDGTEVIVIPNNVSTEARIMVEAADNIFYNVNSSNFTINSTVPTFILTNPNGGQFACNIGDQEVNFILNLDFVNDFSEAVTLAAVGNPEGSVVSFSKNQIIADEEVMMTVSGLNGITPGNYKIQVEGKTASLSQDIAVDLTVTNQNFNPLVLLSPANETPAFNLRDNLIWQADANAASYDIEIAQDANFNTVVLSDTVVSNLFSIFPLEGNVTYFWRVRPKNSCGTGNFSEVFSFTTIAPYCVSNFNDDPGGSEHILNVTFNTINHSSGNDTVDGYEDFTEINTCLKRGETQQISITADAVGFQDHCYVFIDWNRDLEFDKLTERFDLGNIRGNIATNTLDITVPNDAVFGSTRMRVVLEYFTNDSLNGDGACDEDHQFEWGETEDYTIIVSDKTTSAEEEEIEDMVDMSIYPNPTDGNFTLVLNNSETNEILVRLVDSNGRLMEEQRFLKTESKFTRGISFRSLVAGLYFLEVINGQVRTRKKMIFK